MQDPGNGDPAQVREKGEPRSETGAQAQPTGGRGRGRKGCLQGDRTEGGCSVLEKDVREDML